MKKSLKICQYSFPVIVILLTGIIMNNIAFSDPRPPKGLTLDSRVPLLEDNTIVYYFFKGIPSVLNKYTELEIIDIDLNNKDLTLTPLQADSPDTVKTIAEKHNAVAAINGGFFDYINGKSVSYTVINGITTGDPSKNSNLTENPDIKPYLDKIYNRAELRILNCKGKIEYQIDEHYAPLENCTLISSLQGGPALLPEMDLEKEAFLAYKNGAKVRESANVTNPDARTGIGLTDDNRLYFVINRTGYKNSDFYGLTIEEFARLLSSFKIKKALAFDGGSSTTLYYKTPEGKTHTTTGKVNQRKNQKEARVKSIMAILNTRK
jgi:hypothetical protein